MNRKETFINQITILSICRDIRNHLNDTDQVVHIASKIPKRRIPRNPYKSASRFMLFVDGKARGKRWMQPTKIKTEPQ